MLNHFRTKLLDHDSYNSQAYLGWGKQSTGSEGDRGMEGDGTLLFLVELQPSLIVSSSSGQGNATLMQTTSPGWKLLLLLRKWARQRAGEGPKEEGVETMRPLFGFTLSINKDCDLMERRVRIDEDENKMWILSKGQRLDNTNAENKLDQCHSYCLLAYTEPLGKGDKRQVTEEGARRVTVKKKNLSESLLMCE
jgi:hypothetical protein